MNETRFQQIGERDWDKLIRDLRELDAELRAARALIESQAVIIADHEARIVVLEP